MKRESFGSRLGFLLVSAGCAIGIGNVWRFPYITGKNGGGYFVLFYLICLLLLGVPVLGYRYSVALPEKGLDKVDVRIDGQQQAEAPNGYVEVRFDGLEVFIYWSKGEYHVGAKATGIHIVNPKP